MNMKLINLWILLIPISIFGQGLNNTINEPVIPKKIPITNTIWSSASGAFLGEKNMKGILSWKRLNERLKSANGGIGLMGHRSYDKEFPVNFASSAMAEDIGNCPVSIVSFKLDWIKTADGTNDEVLKAYIQSIPDDRLVYLTFHHEPEDEVKGPNTNEVLQRAFARFVSIVIASGKPNLHPCFVLMSWTFNPKSKRNINNFNMAKYLKPEQLKYVVAGMDGYAHDPSESAREIFEGSFAKFKSWGFTRFGIFETGVHGTSDISARSVWINDLGKWAKSRKDIELVSWFNSGVGPHAGSTGWFLGNWSQNGQTYTWDDADGTIAAYANLLK